LIARAASDVCSALSMTTKLIGTEIFYSTESHFFRLQEDKKFPDWGMPRSQEAHLMGSDKPDLQDDTITDIDDETAEPPNFKVLLHNDDFTTKAFVVEILLAVFNKSLEDATRLMWYVHQNGTGVCGIYPLEVAETKIAQVTELARENGFPLKLTLEEE
jgi:ATP-dependent Clp protease adaptor protein ClpS